MSEAIAWALWWTTWGALLGGTLSAALAVWVMDRRGALAEFILPVLQWAFVCTAIVGLWVAVRLL